MNLLSWFDEFIVCVYISTSQHAISDTFLTIYCHTMVNVGCAIAHAWHVHRHRLGVVMNGKNVPAIWATNSQNPKRLNDGRCKNKSHNNTSRAPRNG